MKSIKTYIILAIYFLSFATVLEAQSGFLGRKVSLGIAPTFFKPQGQSFDIKSFSPKISLNICEGRRGELSLGYRQGKSTMMTGANFETTNQILPEIEFPAQKVRSFHIEQRLYRRSSESPVGSYFGIGVQRSQYTFSTDVVYHNINGSNKAIYLGNDLDLDIFNQFYYTFGKKFVIKERLLVDVQLIRTKNAEFTGISSVYFKGFFATNSIPDNIYRINESPDNSFYELSEDQYNLIKRDFNEILESNTRRRIQVHISVHYLLF